MIMSVLSRPLYLAHLGTDMRRIPVINRRWLTSISYLFATTFHGLSCRRCTGHLSCCKRYRRDSNTDYISVGQISNLMRYHYSTIPYLIIHHLTALCETHGQYNHPLNISQGFCKTLLFYLYSLNFIQIKL